MMDQATAIRFLKTAIENGKKLNPHNDRERERFVLDSRATLDRVFGKDSRQSKEFINVSWTHRRIVTDTAQAEKLRIEARETGRARAIVLLEAALHEVEQFHEMDQAEGNADPSKLIERLCERFHIIARQLRQRHNGRPTLDVSDEYDVQDLIHALLLLDFDDVRPEEWTPSYAGACARVDFILKREKIAVEVKRTRKGLGAKEVGEQLIVDCQRYKNHPDCKTLVCFVYDPEGLVANPRGVENDLSTAGGEMPVKVSIRP